VPFFSGGGGGGSMFVYESGYYQQDSRTNIANGGSAYLPFEDLAGGDAVLSLTAPTAPTVVKAGLFIVSCEVYPNNLTAGGNFLITLLLDSTGTSVEMENASDAEAQTCQLSNSWVMEAGDAISLQCFNGDGAAARDFHIANATVSRVGPA
jgi:hypothetical protein